MSALIAAISVAFLFSEGATQPSPLTIQPSTGRVGIGSSVDYPPAAKLDVASASNATDVLRVSVGNAPYMLVNVGQYGADWLATSNTGHNDYVLAIGTRGGPTGSYNSLITWGKTILGSAGCGTLCNVGIGTTNPLSTLHVAGTLSATVKQFHIPHPLEPLTKALVHASLEGPEHAVYYRGAGQLTNGEAVVTLPAYFERLTRQEERTVQLTPIGGWSPLYVEGGVAHGRFTVRAAAGGSPGQRFYWEVKAVRADAERLTVEKLHDQGADARPQP